MRLLHFLLIPLLLAIPAFGASAPFTTLRVSTNTVLSDAQTNFFTANNALITVPQGNVVSLVTDLALKAPLGSPALTGNPTAPTATAGDNDTSIATTEFAENAGRNRFQIFKSWEFLGDSSSRNTFGYPDLVGLGVGTGGTLAGVSAEANHYGMGRFTSGTTANSGYTYYGSMSAFITGGGEEASFVFRVPVTNATQVLMGYHDSALTQTPVDGIAVRVGRTSGTWNLLEGVCVSNSVVTATATGYNILQSTWYSANIAVNAAGNSTTFTLNDESGTQLWTDTAAGLPTGTARAYGYVLIAWSTNTSATAVLDLDYADLKIDRTLVR